MGFCTSLRRDFTHLNVVGTYCGHDDVDGNHREVLGQFESQPDLVGVYNFGGANPGVARALRAAVAAMSR